MSVWASKRNKYSETPVRSLTHKFTKSADILRLESSFSSQLLHMTTVEYVILILIKLTTFLAYIIDVARFAKNLVRNDAPNSLSDRFLALSFL